MTQIQQLLQSHPHWPAVESIYHTLQGRGYKAFLAGGCVRDALLGLQAHDLDVATDATPDEIEKLFAKTIEVGKSFGVMRVIINGADIEVATFRNDLTYKDGRRPEGVRFSSPQEDALRRDFTVNALFYDLASQKVLDFVHGEADLRRSVLRTVGEPSLRFKEDHLRLLRAARFVAQLDFVLEEKTFAAIQSLASLVKTVSGERLRDEMGKLLKAKAVPQGLEVMRKTGLLEQLFPFRLRDNSWRGDYGAQETWQRLALFCRTAEKNEAENTTELLRLSTREKRALLRACEVWRDPAGFFTLSLGKKLLKMPEEGVLWAVEVLRQEGRKEAQDLLREWDQWQRQLPPPFLSGEDVKAHLNGKAIGLCLEKAYEQQLERTLHSRDEALAWLKKYLESGQHG